jgi:uncharacterized protein YpmB
MEPANKTRIALIIGIFLIVSVASLVVLPFMNSSSPVQKVSQETIKKIESSEERILGFTAQEKTELESKIGGKLQP